jgi:DNA-binding response OmpR family regulator
MSAETSAAPDTRRRVVLIEDDADIAEAIAYQLGKDGLRVDIAATGEEGLAAVQRPADLVVLDLNLPGIDGLEVCRLIRVQTSSGRLPIIIVSARGDELDRVLGLELGADDYLVKPFSLKELAARCRAALRWQEASRGTHPSYRDGELEISFEGFTVRHRGVELRLTRKEFELLRYLVERPDRVVTRERLLERVWGYDPEVSTRSIDAHVRRLRAKLVAARSRIETVVGLGYRFVRGAAG